MVFNLNEYSKVSAYSRVDCSHVASESHLEGKLWSERIYEKVSTHSTVTSPETKPRVVCMLKIGKTGAPPCIPTRALAGPSERVAERACCVPASVDPESDHILAHLGNIADEAAVPLEAWEVDGAAEAALRVWSPLVDRLELVARHRKWVEHIVPSSTPTVRIDDVDSVARRPPNSSAWRNKRNHPTTPTSNCPRRKRSEHRGRQLRRLTRVSGHCSGLYRRPG